MKASTEDLHDAKLNSDNVRVPDGLGGGYLVSLEVTHQLHCLVSPWLSSINRELIARSKNFLRKATYLNWIYYQNRSLEFQDGPKTIEMHLGQSKERFTVRIDKWLI